MSDLANGTFELTDQAYFTTYNRLDQQLRELHNRLFATMNEVATVSQAMDHLVDHDNGFHDDIEPGCPICEMEC